MFYSFIDDYLEKTKDTDRLLYYKNLANLSLTGEGDRIGDLVDKKLRSKILSYLPSSLKVWDKSLTEFARVETVTETPYRLNEEKKPYAVESIAISEALDFNLRKIDFALQANNIYFLTIHLIDDLLEDPTKFYSKFKYEGRAGKERRVRTAGTSFIYNANIAIHNIIERSGKLGNANILGTETNVNESLAKKIKFFEIKNQALTQDNILEIKNRKVSGEASSFFLEFVRLDNSYLKRINEHVRSAIMYLGSMTQFTDDLRDLDEDKRNKNINLLLSLGGLRTDAAEDWAKLYLREEQNMIRSIEQSKLDVDLGLLSIIPWYPFFAKKEFRDMLRKG